MRRLLVVATLVALGTPLAFAQAGASPAPYVPRYTLSTGYEFLRSNAPPNVSNGFSLIGGYFSTSVAIKYWLHAEGEVTGSHSTNIGPLGQGLNLLTYTGGPQVVLHPGRFEPHAQVLFGGAHGFDSYFPTTSSYSASANSFALQTGGGLDFILSPRIGIRAIEVQYLHTGFPNGVDGKQNHLMIGAGIALRLHGSMWTPDPRGERRAADNRMRKEENHPSGASTLAPSAPPPPPPPSVASTPPSTAASTGTFAADNMPNAYFDYDSADLRSDALAAIQTASSYLKAHATVHIVVGGYADERGSAEYDLALGERRAQAARDALVANGITPDRLQVVSYGKEVQVCQAEDEKCFQKNRRAGFEAR